MVPSSKRTHFVKHKVAGRSVAKNEVSRDIGRLGAPVVPDAKNVSAFIRSRDEYGRLPELLLKMNA